MAGSALALHVRVHGGGGVLSRAHGQDHGGGAGDGVAAGVDALAGGSAGLLVRDDAAPLLGAPAPGWWTGSGGWALVPMAMITQSTASSNSLPSSAPGGGGRTHPARPASIFDAARWPRDAALCSSPRISTGLVSRLEHRCPPPGRAPPPPAGRAAPPCARR